MQIHVKLRGVLKEKTPPGDAVELDDGATLRDLLAELDIPVERIHLVMVNDEQCRDHDRPLADGDEVMLLPPIAGG
jgi:molybdopterin converting factor small subunit